MCARVCVHVDGINSSACAHVPLCMCLCVHWMALSPLNAGWLLRISGSQSGTVAAGRVAEAVPVLVVAVEESLPAPLCCSPAAAANLDTD